MADWSELKIDVKIVHIGLHRKGSKTRQNDEVRTSFLPDFLENLQKMVDFQGQNAAFLAKPSKSVIFAKFS